MSTAVKALSAALYARISSDVEGSGQRVHTLGGTRHSERLPQHGRRQP